MIKPLNYSIQAATALKAMRTRSEKSNKGEKFEEIFGLKEFNILELLDTSPKFILPTCGLYFSEIKRDLIIEDQMLHLPFPTVILEYPFPKEEHNLREGTSYSTKRIIILQEETLDYGKNILFTGITATILVYMDHLDLWMVIDGKIMLPRKDNHTAKTLQECCMFSEKTDTPLIPIPIIKGAFNNRVKICKGDTIEAARQLLQDCYDEIIAVTHFLNVISCKNVETKAAHKTPRPLGKLGKGKKEYYDQVEKDKYLILQIKPEQEQSHHSSRTEYKGVIRQHIRRGHIRRLPSGNIWITNCIVGNPDKGRITKDYALT